MGILAITVIALYDMIRL